MSRIVTAVALLSIALISAPRKYCGAQEALSDAEVRGAAPSPDSEPLERLGEEAAAAIAQVFDYEASIPLESRIVERSMQDDGPREKIVFRGVQGFLAPGYLQLPPGGNGPSACVLLLHGWSGSKEHWWQNDNYISGGNLRRELLQAGFAVLALDAQCHGDRIAVNDFAPVNHFVDPDLGAQQPKSYFTLQEIYVQTTRDYRRAIDYLATRSEIDARRIGMVGYSMGGTQTFMLMGVEPRVQAAVAVATPADPHKRSLVAPRNFVRGLGVRPLLTILGRSDELCPLAHGLALQRLLTGKHHQQVLLDGGHKLPASYVPHAVRWLKEHL